MHAVSIGLLPLCLINKLTVCWKWYTLEWFEWYQAIKIVFVRYFRVYFTGESKQILVIFPQFSSISLLLKFQRRRNTRNIVIVRSLSGNKNKRIRTNDSQFNYRFIIFGIFLLVGMKSLLLASCLTITCLFSFRFDLFKIRITKGLREIARGKFDINFASPNISLSPCRNAIETNIGRDRSTRRETTNDDVSPTQCERTRKAPTFVREICKLSVPPTRGSFSPLLQLSSFHSARLFFL